MNCAIRQINISLACSMAFRNGIGCEQVLVNVTEQWKLALNNDKIIGTILMDLSKAFDCLPHKQLISI